MKVVKKAVKVAVDKNISSLRGSAWESWLPQNTAFIGKTELIYYVLYMLY